MSLSNICDIHVPNVVRCINRMYEESTTDDDGHQPIAVSHLGDSGDLTIENPPIPNKIIKY